MPLAFNWESAPLSLPSLIGYLFPVRLAYTVQVLVTIVVAGTGVYVLGKVLRLGMLGCMTAAVAFELCGPFVDNLGWAGSSIWSLAGWILAAMILILRGEKRARMIVFLAIAIAFAIYAGDPEVQVLLALSLVILVLVILLYRVPALGGSGPVIRPLVDLGVAAIAGTALAAPLILPGVQLGGGSNRTAVGADLFPKGLPPKELFHLIFQGFDGLPVLHSQYFGLSAYAVTSAYVGVIVLVLAATGLVLRWRRPEVGSFGVLAVALALLVFTPPLVSLLDSKVADIYWIFALTPLCLAIAVLAGVGMDVVVTSWSGRRVRQTLGLGFVGMAVLLGIIWLVARRGLTPEQASIRAHSFVWPAIEVIVGLAVVWMLPKVAAWTRTRLDSSAAGVAAGSLLFLVLTGFLISAGTPLYSSSTHYPTSTPAVTALEHVVGTSVVGIGGQPAYPEDRGIMVNANLLYDIQEFGAYDPVLPHAYFELYGTPVSEYAAIGDVLNASITSARAARLYGVRYVLERSGVSGPKGSVFVRKLGDEDLYRIPGATAATLVGLRPNGSLPGMYASGAPVSVTHPSPRAWKMITHSTAPSVLRLRLTNVPGWRATIDGKSVDIDPFARIMLQVRIPPGRHVVELQYWPESLSVGIVLAVGAACGLAILLTVARFRSRRIGTSRRSLSQPSGPT